MFHPCKFSQKVHLLSPHSSLRSLISLSRLIQLPQPQGAPGFAHPWKQETPLCMKIMPGNNPRKEHYRTSHDITLRKHLLPKDKRERGM